MHARFARPIRCAGGDANDLLLSLNSMFSAPMSNDRMQGVLRHANGSPTSGGRSRMNGRFRLMSGRLASRRTVHRSQRSEPSPKPPEIPNISQLPPGSPRISLAFHPGRGLTNPPSYGFHEFPCVVLALPARSPMSTERSSTASGTGTGSRCLRLRPATDQGRYADSRTGRWRDRGGRGPSRPAYAAPTAGRCDHSRPGTA